MGIVEYLGTGRGMCTTLRGVCTTLQGGCKGHSLQSVPVLLLHC